MTTANESGAVSIDFTWAEEWLVHHVVLDTMGLAAKEPTPRADDPPWRVVRILEAIEEGQYAFTLFELDFIRDACRAYANNLEGHTDDHEQAEAIIDQVSRAIEGAGRPVSPATNADR